jgi:ABC-type sugar transport system ATPase subunit
MCDRFLVIGNGRIVGELDKKDASEAAIIRMASCV